ncbi:MAG: hypothetical protein U9O85_00380 [Euryarchaeota archaeon]|nr:hypothetical protein [Euryarchaeota archaeon]
MKLESYFKVYELSLILLFALASAMLNTYLPLKAFTEYLGIPGPAAGMALLGGFIFAFWVALACDIIKKRYAGIITSLLIASFCLLIYPWYGVVSPPWFGVYGIIALLSMGILVELTAYKSGLVVVTGGGLGNLACLIITWLAIGVHAGVWVQPKYAPILILAAFVSGSVGSLMAYWIAKPERTE